MFQTGVWFCYKCYRQVPGSALDSILVLFLAFKVRRVCLSFAAEYWVKFKSIFSCKELWVARALYVMETSAKYNRHPARIPKGMGVGKGVVGSLSFNVQGRERVLPNSDPFGQIEKRGRGCKNWILFMDIINLWFLTQQSDTKLEKNCNIIYSK